MAVDLDRKKVRKDIIITAVVMICIISVMIYLIGFKNLHIIKDAVIERPAWFLVIFSVFLTSFVFRTIRWSFIVGSMKIETSIFFMFKTTLTGWFFNAITPGKIGEFVRIYALNNEYGLKVGKGTASIVVERVFDLIVLILLASGFIYVETSFSSIGSSVRRVLMVSILVFLGLLALIFLIIIFTEKLLEKIRKIIPLPVKFYNAILSLVRSFKGGLNDLKEKHHSLVFVFLITFPIWIFDASTIYLTSRFLGVEGLNILTCLIVGLFGFMTMVISLTPGGAGLREAIEVLILIKLSEISTEIALIIILVDHLAKILIEMVLGGIAFATMNFGFATMISDIKNMINQAGNLERS